MSHPNQFSCMLKLPNSKRTGGKGMIRMVQIEYIKKLHFKEGKSIREISKILGHSRNTVSKYLDKDVFKEPKYKLNTDKPAPVLDPVKPIINQWLIEDEQMPKKQRHSAVRIYQRLVEEYGFTGGCSTVRNYVYSKKATPKNVFIPLEYELGSNAQMDWGQAMAIIGGQKVNIHLFAMVLSASGAPFLMAFPNEKQEAFLEGHNQAFTFFGGVPQSVTYDNLRSAVKKVLKGYRREEQQTFIGLRTHYLFDSIFCNVAKGNEKGLVEGFIGYARRNFLVPLPEFSSFQECNEYLQVKCSQYINRGKRKGQLIKELFKQEQQNLQSLPTTVFPSCRYTDTTVNSYSQIQFENNRYSVPCQFVYQKVHVQIYVDSIHIFHNGNLLVTHKRSYGKGLEVSILEHYLDVLVTKPRAIENSRVFRNMTLSPVYEELRRKMQEKEYIGTRQFIKVLQLHKSYPSSIVDEAVQKAISYNVFHFDGVRNMVLQLMTKEPITKPLTLDDSSELLQVKVQYPQIEQFNQLLERG